MSTRSRPVLFCGLSTFEPSTLLSHSLSLSPTLANTHTLFLYQHLSSTYTLPLSQLHHRSLSCLFTLSLSLPLVLRHPYTENDEARGCPVAHTKCSSAPFLGRSAAFFRGLRFLTKKEKKLEKNYFSFKMAKKNFSRDRVVAEVERRIGSTTI